MLQLQLVNLENAWEKIWALSWSLERVPTGTPRAQRYGEKQIIKTNRVYCQSSYISLCCSLTIPVISPVRWKQRLLIYFFHLQAEGWIFLLLNRSNLWDSFLWGRVLEDRASLFSSDQLEQPESRCKTRTKISKSIYKASIISVYFLGDGHGNSVLVPDCIGRLQQTIIFWHG